MAKKKNKGKRAMMDLDKIALGRLGTSALTDAQRKQIRAILEATDGRAGTFEKFEADLTRDIDPQRELDVWQWIADRYQEWKETHSDPKDLAEGFKTTVIAANSIWPIVVQ